LSENFEFEMLWNNAMSQIKAEIGEPVFNRWFDLAYSGSENGQIVVSAPSEFHRDNILKRFSPLIEKVLHGLSNEKLGIVIKTDKKADKTPLEGAQEIVGEAAPEKNQKISIKPEERPVQKSAKLDLNKDFTFENYVVGDNNEFAVNAALAVSRNPGTGYNPLFIYSGVGLGKTHLMQAIGNSIYHNTNSKIIYTTAESFFNDFQESIQEKGMSSFRKKYRQIDVLLVDDIHFLENKYSLQEEFFNTFNALFGAKNQMVFTCDKPVSELKHFSDRLSSRLGSGLPVDIQMPKYEMRYAILKKKTEERNLSISDDIIDLICKNISTNVRDLVAALSKLAGYAELIKKPITLSVAQEQLKDIFASPKQSNVSIENIQQVVANHFSLSVNDLKCKKRTKTLVHPRQLSMYIIKSITEFTTTDIGQAFGGRDHTTVLHSLKIIEERLQSDPTEDRLIQSLIKSIKELSVK
jgi:chromosomal replication initiator protein